jgi:hypothetical protein
VIRRLEQAGRRASLAEPLDWEADEERECVLSFSGLIYTDLFVVGFNSLAPISKTKILGNLTP